MCEFISWVEKKGNIYYLTYRDIYNTGKGKELRDYCKRKEDLIGHGAIRYYYDNFADGKDAECTDFSTPDNFPGEIMEGIKAGKFRGLGIARQLLSVPAWAEYEKIRQPARAEYEKIRQHAWAEYEKIRQPAQAEYEKIEQHARAECEKIEQRLFWDMFKNKKNRNRLWK